MKVNKKSEREQEILDRLTAPPILDAVQKVLDVKGPPLLPKLPDIGTDVPYEDEYMYECSIQGKTNAGYPILKKRQGTLLAASPMKALDKLHDLAKNVWGDYIVTKAILREVDINGEIVATTNCTVDIENKSTSYKPQHEGPKNYEAKGGRNNNNNYRPAHLDWSTPVRVQTFGTFKLQEKDNGKESSV